MRKSGIIVLPLKQISYVIGESDMPTVPEYLRVKEMNYVRIKNDEVQLWL